MSIVDKCEICGKDAKVTIGDGKGGVIANYCMDCHNRRVADDIGIGPPAQPPKQIVVVGKNKKPHRFDVEYMLLPHCQTLRAYEIGKTRFRAEVFGNIEDDLQGLWQRLVRKINKMISTKHIRRDGGWIKSKVVGYVDYNRERDDYDIVVDGKPYTWEQLGREIAPHEGFQIKIEYIAPFDDAFE